MTTIELIRMAQARRSALYHYAAWHDHFSTEEQILTAEGRTFEAEGAHEFALRLLRAYKAEIDDPEPSE